jgi:hypothetical protein
VLLLFFIFYSCNFFDVMFFGTFLCYCIQLWRYILIGNVVLVNSVHVITLVLAKCVYIYGEKIFFFFFNK